MLSSVPLRHVWVSEERGEHSVTQGHSPVQQTDNTRDKCQSILRYCEPLLIYWLSLFLFPFGSPKPSHFMPTVSHKYFLASAALVHFLHCPSPRLFMWPPSSFDWICLAPLVSARANLPHQHSFGLVFHPPTLEKTVCSKDCNLTTNLYGFLQSRAASL